LETEVFDLAGNLVQKTKYEYVTYAEDQRRSNSFLGFRVQAKPAQSNQTLLCETRELAQGNWSLSSADTTEITYYNEAI